MSHFTPAFFEVRIGRQLSLFVAGAPPVVGDLEEVRDGVLKLRGKAAAKPGAPATVPVMAFVPVGVVVEVIEESPIKMGLVG